jgi:hypothetical protein
MDDQRDFESYLQVFRRNVTPAELNALFVKTQAPVSHWTPANIFGAVGIAGLVAVGIWVGTNQNRIETLEEGRIVARAERNAQIAALDVRIRGVELSVSSGQTDTAALKTLIMQGFSDIGRRLERLENRP